MIVDTTKKMKRCAGCRCPVTAYTNKKITKEMIEDKETEEYWKVLNTLKEREKKSIIR